MATSRQSTEVSKAHKVSKASPRTPRRAEPPAVRRKQLISATMRSIAKHGLSGTTMATITREAGLSVGIANLHFQSKEKLLLATLEFIAEEYNSGQAAVLADTDHKNLAEKLQDLVDFHFSKTLTQKNKLAVWFAFFGESKSRPTYQRIWSGHDIQSEAAIHDLFERIVDDGNYLMAHAQSIARGYTAMIDGLWLDLLIAPRELNRIQAKEVAAHYLASVFPKHMSCAAK